MVDNVQKTGGAPKSYKFDRGGAITEFGPFIGVIKNNVDPSLSGRVQVYIEQFSGENEEDKSLWRTVSYVPPFYGTTPVNNNSGSQGDGNYRGNPQSYGFWFTPPDLGTRVICFFVAGDPNQGYYVGCVPEPGVTHMLPAIGASDAFTSGTSAEQSAIAGAGATQVPVVEINSENEELYEDPKFSTQPKPIHGYQFATFAAQGLLGDTTRGPITSTAQRESPSRVFGMSTPGRPVYQGGITDDQIREQVDSDTLSREDLKIEGRRGGHTILMDDGDLSGNDNLIRIRTSKGHQITMSDDQDCFYITHANGKSWIEFGSEGTLDVFSTNSVNVRTEGTINLHADADININAGENINMYSGNVNVTGTEGTNLMSSKYISMATQGQVDITGGDMILMASKYGGWSTSTLALKGKPILLNTGPVKSPKAAGALRTFQFENVTLNGTAGWQAGGTPITSIVTRAPTHEPYAQHNKGVEIVPATASPQPGTQPTNSQLSSALSQSRATNPTVNNPVSVANVLNQPQVTQSIAGLVPSQVTGLLADTAQQVSQVSNVATGGKGIGTYGLTSTQLESSGYLKPGTTQYAQNLPVTVTTADESEAQQLRQTGVDITAEIVAKGRLVNQVLRSPQVWTGLNKVEDLNTLLNNPILQGNVQQNVLQNSFRALNSVGLITGNEKITDIASMLQGVNQFGIQDMTSFALGILPGGLGGKINKAIAQADYAMNLVDTGLASFQALSAGNIAGLGSLVNSVSGLAGLFGGSSGRKIAQKLNSPAINTFIFAAEQAVTVASILSDGKITPPNYSPIQRNAVSLGRFTADFTAFRQQLFELRSGLIQLTGSLQGTNNNILSQFGIIGAGRRTGTTQVSIIASKNEILQRQLATTGSTEASLLAQLNNFTPAQIGTVNSVLNDINTINRVNTNINNSIALGLTDLIQIA